MTTFMKLLQFLTLLAFGVFLLISPLAAQDVQFNNEPAIEVFTQLQNDTNFTFLYRESLVSDLNLSLRTTHDTFIQDLRNTLKKYNLTLRADTIGNQLIVLPFQEKSSSVSETIRISGQVVDSQTGERLPYSTISWRKNGTIKGITTTDSGRFLIVLKTNREEITLRTSFVGYNESNTFIKLQSDNNIADLTIRLEPQDFTGDEIIVIGNRYYSPQDSSLTGLIRTDRFSPFGDDNAVRALQILPSVGTTTAMNDGLNIRGSTPDGFHLSLDGITIFNQSHLFGLLDSFNADAVLNSGFFYDVSPAHISSPIGGKLSLTTRNGSLQHREIEAGISNTSVKATIGGPVKKGASSWLLSGRTSYMNQVDWFNNNQLIRWGLDINRPNSGIDASQNINAELVTPRDSDVAYFDLHGKLYFEQKSGNRTMLSLYFGGDQTDHLAERLTRSRPAGGEFETVDVETKNSWSNFALSTQHQRTFSSSVYSNTTLALSAYETEFSKDDFLYSNTVRSGESLQTTVFAFPLLNRSTMNRVKLDQSFDITADLFPIKTGFTAIYHKGQYREESFERQQFFTETESFQGDLFFQSEFNPTQFMTFHTGLRSHFFSDGHYFRLSPRLKVNLFEDRNFSMQGGFSRNHQFVSRIGFSNAVTADVWILANNDQPPSSADQFTAGVYIKPFRRFYLQFEAYHKNYNYLRTHELNARTLTNTFNDSPWFFENEGEGKGLETLVRYRSPLFTFTQAYTLSSMKLRNESLNNGNEFFAPWDRTHSSTTNLEIRMTPAFSVFAAFILASGSMSGTFDFTQNLNKRLDTYSRLDLSALYKNQIGDSSVSFKFSVFNVLDRKNPWYRELQPVIVTRNRVPAIRSEAVSIFDLGIQPSFEFKIDF